MESDSDSDATCVEDAGAIGGSSRHDDESATAASLHSTPCGRQEEAEAEEEVSLDDIGYALGEVSVELEGGFSIPRDLYDYLFEYQRRGVAWLWQHHLQNAPGCILGDDMGLGKSIQTASFIRGLLGSGSATHILLVAPVTLLEPWMEELGKRCRRWPRGLFHGNSIAGRQQALRQIQRSGGVSVTSYGMVQSNAEALSEIEWDYVFLDEGHKIKNAKNKVAQALRQIPSSHRVILTGTPVQNNLHELWALFDYLFQGRLLGSAKDFKMKYELKVSRGNAKDASEEEKIIGLSTSTLLHSKIEPYLLRREKKDVLTVQAAAEAETSNSSGIETKQLPSITQKSDLVLWLVLSSSQERLYRAFLDSEDVRMALNRTRSPLAAMTVLKKICDHPSLLKPERADALEGNTDSQSQGGGSQEGESQGGSQQYQGLDVVRASTKLKVIGPLLKELKKGGHRCLVFSSSTRVLNMIEALMQKEAHKYLRIDGKVINAQTRQNLVRRFNNDSSIFCFLLTTQVAGVGITLTGADRVIIFDPTWNPATDNQAVDRAYRVGQKKDVVVYRLITCSTIEEKIYRKQVFKGSLSTVVDGNKHRQRYFTSGELSEMFTLDDPNRSETHRILSQAHEAQATANNSDELRKHMQFVEGIPGVSGISQHDLLYTRDQDTVEDDRARSEEEKEEPGDVSSEEDSFDIPPPAVLGNSVTTDAKEKGKKTRKNQGSSRRITMDHFLKHIERDEEIILDDEDFLPPTSPSASSPCRVMAAVSPRRRDGKMKQTTIGSFFTRAGGEDGIDLTAEDSPAREEVRISKPAEADVADLLNQMELRDEDDETETQVEESDEELSKELDENEEAHLSSATIVHTHHVVDADEDHGVDESSGVLTHLDPDENDSEDTGDDAGHVDEIDQVLSNLTLNELPGAHASESTLSQSILSDEAETLSYDSPDTPSSPENVDLSVSHWGESEDAFPQVMATEKGSTVASYRDCIRRAQGLEEEGDGMGCLAALLDALEHDASDKALWANALRCGQALGFNSEH